MHGTCLDEQPVREREQEKNQQLPDRGTVDVSFAENTEGDNDFPNCRRSKNGDLISRNYCLLSGDNCGVSC